MTEDFDTAPPAGKDYQGAGYDIGLEDKAIVCWEAVRALRATQGNHTMKGWMHGAETDKSRMVSKVLKHTMLTDPDTPFPEDTAEGNAIEERLIFAINKALAPD